MSRELREELRIRRIVRFIREPIAEAVFDPPFVQETTRVRFFGVDAEERDEGFQMDAAVGIGWFDRALLRGLRDSGALTPANDRCFDAIFDYMGCR